VSGVAVLVWTLAVVLAAVLTWVVVLTALRVRRLDRLHARVDAARSGLVAALDERAAVALRVAAAVDARTAAQVEVAVAATRVAGTAWPERETAENRLGRVLAGLDRAGLPARLAGELLDAEQLLVLARRVHNDAVRDTLGLRSRWLVRRLHLAGRAPLPRYFEIADPDAGVTTTAPLTADWS
jgi:hypothetical protein